MGYLLWRYIFKTSPHDAFCFVKEKPTYTHLLFLSGETHIEFCCHLARGNIDPKEPPTYEYVKFVGDFKFHNNGKCFDFSSPKSLFCWGKHWTTPYRVLV